MGKSETMVATDQRKSKRFDLRLPIRLVREGDRRLDEEGETVNLSSAGVLFRSHAALQIGAPIEYLITLQPGGGRRGGIQLHCVGKVVRRHQTGDETEDGIAMAATLERYEFVRRD